MPAIIMGVMAGASAIMGGMGDSAQAGIQQAQAEEAQFNERRQVAAKNYEAAKANAMRWMNNKNIAAAANKTRAEEEFYLQYNFKNETGIFSRNVKATNDALMSRLHSKNLKGQTAKQLMQQSIEGAKNAMVNKRVGFENNMRNAERRQQQSLSKRDFGYNDSISYIPGGIQDANTGGIMGMALAQGVMSGISTGVMVDAQTKFMNDQNQVMNSAMSGIEGSGSFVGPPSSLSNSFVGPRY